MSVTNDACPYYGFMSIQSRTHSQTELISAMQLTEREKMKILKTRERT
jgi:hypothetical protein